jgi:hypothetical protein
MKFADLAKLRIGMSRAEVISNSEDILAWKGVANVGTFRSD